MIEKSTHTLYESPRMETEELFSSELICLSGGIPDLVFDNDVNWFN